MRHSLITLAGCPCCTGLLWAGFLWAGSAPASDIDFSRDVRPILSENCVFCHGPDEATREADLRLDTAESTWSMIEKGNAEESELFRRLTSHDASEVMPPADSNRKLTADQIELVRRWINSGADWESHWSLRPIEPPIVPADVHPIDAVVQRQLDAHGLQRSPPASKATLIRRVTLDLTGLPPTPQAVADFLADDTPQAYERVVDRLLASPAYGQRMAWDWLDAARYADTNGYQGDNERTMWPWRDWVVEAFNRNLPYDQFTIWQLAGDLLPSATDEQILATAFLRNHMINGEGGRIAEENRVEYVFDMTETVGTVWLGLTLNCCRCHDHKYDPLANQEYYQLTAFFNQTPVDGSGGDPRTAPLLAVPTAAQSAAIDSLNQQISVVDQQLAAWQTSTDQQTPQQVDETEYVDLNKQREALIRQRDSVTADIAQVMVMADRKEPRETFLLTRGTYSLPTDPVVAGLPACLPSDSVSDRDLNRLDLARWLVDPENPLTARVTVNRFWQQLFGVGLVKTSEDFGTQGEIPIQAALLDYLAAHFQNQGWDVKDLMRLIVTSQTYQQSSIVAADVYEHDPENRLLTRGPRFRLPAWMIRDQALAASGLLSDASGGPAINTYQPPGIWEEASFGNKQYTQDAGEKLYRRSLYVFWRRIIAPPMFFDNSKRQTCSVKPSLTNTPLQALQVLNDVTYVEAARVLGQHALLADLDSDTARIDHVMQRLLARSATDAERDILTNGLQRTRQQYQQQPDQAAQLLALGESARQASIDPIEHAAWTNLCLAILNLDETVTKQ
jgi:mono/diheme cytochrome c family protein